MKPYRMHETSIHTMLKYSHASEDFEDSLAGCIF